MAENKEAKKRGWRSRNEARKHNWDGREPDDQGRIGLGEMRAIGLGSGKEALRLEEVGDLVVSHLCMKLAREETGKERREKREYREANYGYL